MATPTIADLTQATVDGSGVFDVLMKANKAHLEQEFSKNRIKGPEYATVYLGSLTQVMQTALSFLLTKEKTGLEIQLLEQQILLAKKQVEQANATLVQMAAQTDLIVQQKANLVAEANNIPKQGLLLEAQKEVQLQQKLALVQETLRTTAQTAQVTQETTNLASQKLQIEAQTLLIGQQKTNLIAEALNIPKQGLLLDAQKDVQAEQKTNLLSQNNQIKAETSLAVQKTANAAIEQTVLAAQECKLRAEYDLTMSSVTKTTKESELLVQKTATEKAQILSIGVDADSLIGRQKSLYQNQADGFKRDSEQKAAKIMIDTWNTRRMTDETGTDPTTTNKLTDVYIGNAVTKLLDGIGAASA